MQEDHSLVYELLECISRGDTLGFMLRIRFLPDVNETGDTNISFVREACMENRPEILEILISEGANIGPDSRNDWTALHHAAHSNATECIRVLVEYGANVESKTGGGHTPLHVAATTQSAEGAKALLECGANPVALCNHGITALILAERNHNVKCAELLKSYSRETEK